MQSRGSLQNSILNRKRTGVQMRHSGFCMRTKLDWLKTIKLDILNIPDNRYNLHQDNQCGPERISKRFRKGDYWNEYREI